MSFDDFLFDFGSIAITCLSLYSLYLSAFHNKEKKIILLGLTILAASYVSLQLAVAHEVDTWDYGDLIGEGRVYSPSIMEIEGFDSKNFDDARMARFHAHRAGYTSAAITGNNSISVIRMVFRGTMLLLTVSFLKGEKRNGIQRE